MSGKTEIAADRGVHNEQPFAQAVILVTGGAGFIGSNFIRFLLEQPAFKGSIVNYDKLTYAGNLLNLADMEKKFGRTRYFFEQGDICDHEKVKGVFDRHQVSVVVHFAAESHVDRSIFGPKDFIETNVNGTFNLLEVARQVWSGRKDVRFHHISTDEVYGSLGEAGAFSETTAYDPRSPYSASKAASDHLVKAYFHTYGLPITISNCSNNYGPYHFPEKLIPLMILNAIEGKDLPLYGDGKNVRDWLYVEDHCNAIWLIVRKGKTGETYNIGGECEKQNIEVVKHICDALEKLRPAAGNPSLRTPPARVLSLSEPPAPDQTRMGCGPGGRASSEFRTYKDLITFVGDRPGHDRRYAINCDKIKKKLGWKQKYDFETGLRETVSWYLENSAWVKDIRTGEYRMWIEKNYVARK